MSFSATLAELIKRLETATSRLEALSKGPAPVPPSARSPAGTASADKKALVEAETMSPAAQAYDEIIKTQLRAFLAASESVGGLVKEQSLHIQTAFASQLQIISTASLAKKPDAPTLQTLVVSSGLQPALQKVVEIKDKNRPSPLFNHLSAVAEGAPGLGWVMISGSHDLMQEAIAVNLYAVAKVEPKPAPYVEEMKQAAQFYTNRVLKEFKDKDKSHVDWAKSLLDLLSELHLYVKKHHTTGLVWNPKGGDAKSILAASAPTATKPSASADSGKPDDGAARMSMFAELSKGEAVTAGLKHVDKSQMTHKNPALRGASVVPGDKKSESAPTSAAGKPSTIAKPPRMELDGSKWFVENYTNNTELVVEITDMRQGVVLYNLAGCTVQIKGKCNGVTIGEFLAYRVHDSRVVLIEFSVRLALVTPKDNCKKCGVVVESVVATVESVNCKSIQLQVTGKLPTISVDKTDGFQIYLSNDSRDVEILSSKSSEMNVSFQVGDDWVEKPVAEQLRTKLVNGALVTELVSHNVSVIRDQ
ncbi:F-actin-capping protein subunit alpha [Gonapodya sp. JEL0774]|nr:F-actin-capping protein subunit alpha [Gonapodya sp. JEL0774]